MVHQFTEWLINQVTIKASNQTTMRLVHLNDKCTDVYFVNI